MLSCVKDCEGFPRAFGPSTWSWWFLLIGLYVTGQLTASLESVRERWSMVAAHICTPRFCCVGNLEAPPQTTGSFSSQESPCHTITCSSGLPYPGVIGQQWEQLVGIQNSVTPSREWDPACRPPTWRSCQRRAPACPAPSLLALGTPPVAWMARWAQLRDLF